MVPSCLQFIAFHILTRTCLCYECNSDLTLVFVWSGAIYRSPCSVDICSLLKTARRSLYEILYFAVLVDRSLSHGHLFHISVFPISIIISTVPSLGAIMNEGNTLMCFSLPYDHDQDSPALKLYPVD